MQFEMNGPLSGRQQRTASGDVEIMRPMAERRTDGDIEIKDRRPGLFRATANLAIVGVHS